MANDGKVKRVLREAVAVLIEELGRNDAASMLETAAAEVRGAADPSKRVAAQRRKARARAGSRSSA
jgi:hypothetical protein